MSEQRPKVKAVESSDLSASQEAGLWIAADVVFLGVLLLLSFIFGSPDSSLPGPSWLAWPLLGWVIGNVLAPFAVAAKIQTPSWLIAGVGLVVVAISAVAFQGAAINPGRGFAGLVIGLLTGFLAQRALRAEVKAHRRTN